MGKKALLENQNMKKAISDCTDSLNEFYLSEELVAEIFEKYKEYVLNRKMCLKTKAAQFMKFKHVEDRGPVYLRKYISRILNYSQNFTYTQARRGRPSHFERIINR